MYRPAMRSADQSSSVSIHCAEPSRPLGRIARVGMVLGICAALGAGMAAGPQLAAPHHSVTASSVQLAGWSLVADTSSITGGPGNV